METIEVQSTSYPAERRSGPDRRGGRTLVSEWRWALRGRRRRHRRLADRDRIYLDWYPSRLLVLALGILLLSALDAGMTLKLVATGLVEEANPLMRALLQSDVRLFVDVKLAVTAIGLLFLVAHFKHRVFQRLPLERLGYWLFALYATLVMTQALMLSTVS